MVHETVERTRHATTGATTRHAPPQHNMAKLLLATALVTLITIVHARTIYYPDTNDPNAIVFEGPTNFKGPDPADISDNEVEEPDYSKQIDVRKLNSPDSAEDRCPKGFVLVDGGLCFPND